MNQRNMGEATATINLEGWGRGHNSERRAREGGIEALLKLKIKQIFSLKWLSLETKVRKNKPNVPHSKLSKYCT